MFRMFIKLYYWKYSDDREPHVGHPCHDANKPLSNAFFRHIPWRKKLKTTLTQMSQSGVVPQKTIMCREQIMLLKWKRNCRLDDDMKRINLFSTLVPFLKRRIFLRVVISTKERRNHTLAIAKWSSPDWCVVFLLSHNKPQFTFCQFTTLQYNIDLQQQTVELSERSVSVQATRSEWELFLRLIHLFFHIFRSLRDFWLPLRCRWGFRSSALSCCVGF